MKAAMEAMPREAENLHDQASRLVGLSNEQQELAIRLLRLATDQRDLAERWSQADQPALSEHARRIERLLRQAVDAIVGVEEEAVDAIIGVLTEAGYLFN